MAQQGGTWDPKKIRRQQDALAQQKESSSESSKGNKSSDKSSSQDDTTDEKEWDVVNNPQDESEPRPHGGGYDSRFNLSVGWGSWKTDVLGWDVKFRRPAHPEAIAASSSPSASTENKKEDEQADTKRKQ